MNGVWHTTGRGSREQARVEGAKAARVGWRAALLVTLAMTWSVAASTEGIPGPQAAASRSLETLVEQAPGLPGYNIYRPANLNDIDRPMPVIVWANGGCVRHDSTWVTLFEKWAGAGYLVAAITALPEAAEADAGASPPSGMMARSSATDQALAIDWASEQNRLAGGPFSGKLDLDRVVAAGNSCGGITSLALASQDDRVASVFVLSGSSVGPGAPREQAAEIMEKIHAPVALVVGGPEDVATAAAELDFELLPEGVPGYVAKRAEADHRVVSTDPAILEEVAEIGIHWFELSLHGDAAARQALTTKPCVHCADGLWTPMAKHLDSL